MAYRDFDLKMAIQKFALFEIRDTGVFADVAPREPSAFLRVWLDTFAPVVLGANSEKARSEFIVAPMPAETKLQVGASVNALSGVTFEVDKGKGWPAFATS